MAAKTLFIATLVSAVLAEESMKLFLATNKTCTGSVKLLADATPEICTVLKEEVGQYQAVKFKKNAPDESIQFLLYDDVLCAMHVQGFRVKRNDINKLIVAADAKEDEEVSCTKVDFLDGTTVSSVFMGATGSAFALSTSTLVMAAAAVYSTQL